MIDIHIRLSAALRAMIGPEGESAVMLFWIFIRPLKFCGALIVHSPNNFLIAPLVMRYLFILQYYNTYGVLIISTSINGFPNFDTLWNCFKILLRSIPRMGENRE
jgi:hypothetical protein